jgi:acyl transferase domain-containing protein
MVNEKSVEWRENGHDRIAGTNAGGIAGTNAGGIAGVSMRLLLSY